MNCDVDGLVGINREEAKSQLPLASEDVLFASTYASKFIKEKPLTDVLVLSHLMLM